MRNLGGVQAGLHSRSFTGLWLNVRQETSVLHHHRVADRYLFGVHHLVPHDATGQ
jgi:hypothetical protein